MAASARRFSQRQLKRLQARFRTILPRIQLHAKVSSRHIKCPAKRQDFISEVVALCWAWWRRLVERGKRPWTFVSTLASFAARAVHSGRRVCGQLKAKDAMSERAQHKHNFTVQPLPSSTRISHDHLNSIGGQRQHDEFEERLQDNTVTPVPEQVAFRIDWPAWLRTRCKRDRQLIRHMGRGERTRILAKRFQLSDARVSQLRREFHADWSAYCADRDAP